MIGGNVVAAVADGGEKYLHTVFSEDWLKERKLLDPEIWETLDGWINQESVEEAPRAIPRLSVA